MNRTSIQTQEYEQPVCIIEIRAMMHSIFLSLWSYSAVGLPCALQGVKQHPWALPLP
jgi:hypothetical protein